MPYGELLANINTKALYRFNSGALTTDSSGKGHTLTAISTPGEVTGKFGGAVNLGGAEVGEDLSLGSDAARFAFKDAYWYAQPFTPTKAFLSTVGLYLYKQNSPTGNLTIEIQTDNDGVPSGSVLATTTLDVSSLTTTSAEYKVSVPCVLTPSTKYHICLKGQAAWDNTNNVFWDINTPGTFAQTNYGTGDFSLNSTAYEARVKTYYAYSLPNSAYSHADHADFKPTSAFTIAGLIKTGTADKLIFQSYSANSNIAGIRFDLTSANKIRLISGKNNGTTLATHWQLIAGNTSIVDSAWHFVVGTWDGSYLRVYVDGVLDGFVAWSDAPAYAATNYVRVGCSNFAGTNADFFNGSMDELNLEAGAWSAQYIRHLYNQMKGRYAPKMI